MKSTLLLFLSIILSSCLFSSKSETAKCDDGMEFNSLSRQCIGAKPIDSLTRFIDEDTPSRLEVGRGNYSTCEILPSSVTPNLVRNTPLTPPSCSCSAGICSVFVTPLENSFGRGSLYFRFNNPNSGPSDYIRLNIVIADRNDAPTLSTLNFTMSVFEDNTSTSPQIASTRAASHPFNMCNHVGSVLSDVDSVKTVSLEIVTPPSLGILSCNDCNCIEQAPSCSCSFIFDGPNVNGAPYTTFGIRFRDISPHRSDPSLATNEATIALNVISVNDRPIRVPDVDLTGTPLTEDTIAPLNLPEMSDVEDGNLISYEIADANNCGTGGDPCTYTLEALRRQFGVLNSCLNLASNGDTQTPSTDHICNFDPYYNVHAQSIIFYYRAVDSLGAVSDWVKVTFRIDSVNDPPIPFFSFYQIDESKTALASDAGPYVFDLAAVSGQAIDQDEENLASPQTPISDYSFVSAGSIDAQFVNCMNNDSDLTCDFEIDSNNGNFNTPGVPTTAQGTLSGLTISALHPGNQGNLLSVGLIPESSDIRSRHHPIPSDYSPDCLSSTGDYNSCREYFNRIVQVFADSGRMRINILLQSNLYTTTDTNVQHLINNHPIVSQFVNATGASGATAVAGNLDLSGGTDASSILRAEYRVHDGQINSAAPNGLISIRITPVNDNPIFCRYSPYEEAPECGLYGCLGHQSPQNKNIVPRSHRDGQPLYYYDITTAICYRSTGVASNNWEVSTTPCLYSTNHHDCNGGDCRAAGPPEGKVTPSTHTNARPVIYQNSNSKVCYQSTGTGINDWELVSASIAPIYVNEGETIKLKRIIFDEGGADPTEDSQRVFISNFHSSNNVLISLKNSEFIQRRDYRVFPCSFSFSSCNNGLHCRQYETNFSDPTGNVIPTNHTQGQPLYFWANQHISQSCYRSTGTTVNDWIQIIDNTTTETVNIYNPFTNNFSLENGGRIAVGEATSSEDDDMIELVLTPTTTESASTIISFDLDDGDCQYSVNAQDCNNGNCDEVNMSFADPTGDITPSQHTNAEPIVYMNNANTCYISTGTNDTDWEVVDAWPIKTVYFKVVVNPNSAILNSWENLTASGPNVNKYNEVKSKDSFSCPYSRAKCNGGGPCTGAHPPGEPPFSVPITIGNEDYAIYHDTRANECYFWNPKFSYPNKWKKFINHCNITQSEFATECINGSCLFDQNAVDLTLFTPTGIDHYYALYDHDTDILTCYRSYGIRPGALGVYGGVGKSVLSWEYFSFTGSSNFLGYNIYRRKAHEDFGEFPINKVILPAQFSTYEDSAIHSKIGPIPGTVYYYQVRPIIDNIETWPLGNNSTARIFVPKANMSFVHRRIVNKRMCELMGKGPTEIDESYHNRCTYIGPGDNTTGHYDIGQDFHTATFEAGCPYTVEEDSCNTIDGNCIADREPHDINDGDDGDFFYNRREGICYWKNTSTSSWGIIDEEVTSILASYNINNNQTKEILKSERPPLSQISQTNAIRWCSDDSMRQSNMIPGCAFSRTKCSTSHSQCTDTQSPDSPNGNYSANEIGTYFWNSNDKSCWRANSTTPGDWTLVGGGGGPVANQFDMRLPTRKEQIAFSFWDKNIDYVTAISYEEGYALNESAGCNSSSADGLIAGYSNLEAPPSHNLYSLPGSIFSGIRSMATGVEETKNCQSTFGIRDIIGNVTEWSSERVTCHSPYNCVFDTTNADFTVQSSSSHINNIGGFRFGYYDENGNGLEDEWDIDGFPIGPCSDYNYDNICDSSFDSWPIESRMHNTRNFILPLGLPAHKDFPYNYDDDRAIHAFARIGSTLGIKGSTLRRDTMDIQSAYIYCPYNKQDPNCAEKDCLTSETDLGSPMNVVTPSGHTPANPLHFFNDNNGQCYRSNGTSNTSWQVIGCHYTKAACMTGNVDCNEQATSFQTPIGNIAPIQHTPTNPIIFYNSTNGNCYISTGTTNTNWQFYGSSNVVSAQAAGIAHGGSYLKGTGAGQFHMEFIDFKSAKDRTDIGLRCVMPIPNDFYTE